MQVPSFKSAGEDYSLKEMTKSTKKSAVSCPWKNACAANVRAFLSVYFPTEGVGGKKVTKVKKKNHPSSSERKKFKHLWPSVSQACLNQQGEQ